MQIDLQHAALLSFVVGVLFTLGKSAATAVLRKLATKMLTNATKADDDAAEALRLIADSLDAMAKSLPSDWRDQIVRDVVTATQKK